MAEHKSGPRRCMSCNREAERLYTVPSVSGGMLNAKELKALEVPLGKKNMENVRNAGDVDKVLDKIGKTYGRTIGGGVGRPSGDPL